MVSRKKHRQIRAAIRRSEKRLNEKVYARIRELQKDEALLEKIDKEMEQYGIEEFKRKATDLARADVQAG